MPAVYLWRCLNGRCAQNRNRSRPGYDFELPVTQPPVCPVCGASGLVHPDTVIERKLLHYDRIVSDDPNSVIRPNRGENVAACDPATPWEGNERVGYTGEPSAVTCPACKRTEAWRTDAVKCGAVRAWDLPPL